MAALGAYAMDAEIPVVQLCGAPPGQTTAKDAGAVLTSAIAALDQTIQILNRMQYDKSLCGNESAVNAHGARVLELVLSDALVPFHHTAAQRTYGYMMGGRMDITFRLVAKSKGGCNQEQLVIFPDGGVPRHDISMKGWDGSTPNRGWSRGNETPGWFLGKIQQLRALRERCVVIGKLEKLGMPPGHTPGTLAVELSTEEITAMVEGHPAVQSFDLD